MEQMCALPWVSHAPITTSPHTHVHTIVTIVIMVHAGGQVAPDTLDHLNRRTLPPRYCCYNPPTELVSIIR